MKTLEKFAIKYEGLREVWGYMFDIQPNYENMTKTSTEGPGPALPASYRKKKKIL